MITTGGEARQGNRPLGHTRTTALAVTAAEHIAEASIDIADARS